MALHRRHLIALALGSPWLRAAGAQAPAAPPEIGSEWALARLVGSGRMRFLGLRIYDARLWAPGAVSGADWPDQPLALELVYARALDGSLIAERSLDEMRRQGEISGVVAERWLDTMKATFPDVRDGDRLTGIYRPGQATRFFENGRLRGDWQDAALARRFFGIWLSPQTSQPSLREDLLGGRT